jgi:hypothetical protein
MGKDELERFLFNHAPPVCGAELDKRLIHYIAGNTGQRICHQHLFVKTPDRFEFEFIFNEWFDDLFIDLL